MKPVLILAERGLWLPKNVRICRCFCISNSARLIKRNRTELCEACSPGRFANCRRFAMFRGERHNELSRPEMLPFVTPFIRIWDRSELSVGAAGREQKREATDGAPQSGGFRRGIVFIWATIGLLLSATPAAAEKVYLTDGRVLNGRFTMISRSTSVRWRRAKVSARRNPFCCATTI